MAEPTCVITAKAFGRPNDDQIRDVMERIVSGPHNHPNLSFEDGIYISLAWILGKRPCTPLED